MADLPLTCLVISITSIAIIDIKIMGLCKKHILIYCN